MNLKKHSSGAKERLFLFLAIFIAGAFFIFSSPAKAAVGNTSTFFTLPFERAYGSYDPDGSGPLPFADYHFTFNDFVEMYNSTTEVTEINMYGDANFLSDFSSTSYHLSFTGGMARYRCNAGVTQLSSCTVIAYSHPFHTSEQDDLINTGFSVVNYSKAFIPSDVDVINYQNGNYSLFVSSPQLSANSKADVQPSANFKIKFIYSVPIANYATTTFQLWTCPNTDFNFPDCTVISSGSIQSIRDNLTDADNLKNYIFAEAPVVLDEYTNLIAVLSDNRMIPYTAIYPAIFLLRGVADTSLPSANSATIEGGFVQDLGFWGNFMRSMFVPSSDFLNGQVTALQVSFFNVFPQFETDLNALKSAANSLHDSGCPTNSIHLSGQDVPLFACNVMDPQIPILHHWISVFLYISLLIYFFKIVHHVLHPGQLNLPL